MFTLACMQDMAAEPASRALRTGCANQCSTFTGMILVFGVLLILFEWYW